MNEEPKHEELGSFECEAFLALAASQAGSFTVSSFLRLLLSEI